MLKKILALIKKPRKPIIYAELYIRKDGSAFAAIQKSNKSNIANVLISNAAPVEWPVHMNGHWRE